MICTGGRRSTISIEINKALVHWWLDLWNQHNVDALGDLVSPDYVHHTSDGTDRSFAQFKEGFAAVLAIFRYALCGEAYACRG